MVSFIVLDDEDSVTEIAQAFEGNREGARYRARGGRCWVRP